MGEIFGKIKNSKYSWIVYVSLTIPVNILLTLTGGCLAFLMIALVTFGIPYLFGVKSTKTFLKAGIFIIIVTGIMFGILYTHFMFNQIYYFEEVPLENGQLKDGILTPYIGDDNTTFNYSVRYTGSEALNNVTVYVNITDLADYDEGIPLKNNGRLFFNETKLNKSTFYYYYFSAYLHNQDKWIRTREGYMGFGPIIMTYADVLYIQIIQGVVYLFLDSGIFFLMIVAFFYWRKTSQQQQKEYEEKMKAEQEAIKKEKEEQEEEEPKEKVVEFECTSCGALVEADAEKCPKCGEGFESEEEKEPKEKVVDFECTSCGAVVDADAEKCPKCGEGFEGEEEKEPKEKVFDFECTSCGAVVEADAEKCPKCGEGFEGEEEKEE